MVYLVPIPGLLIVAFLAINDIRTRQVPRLWVLFGMVVELISMVCYGATNHHLAHTLITAGSIAIVSTLVQYALALIRTNTIGLGDVTAILLTSFSIGVLGWPSALLFWFLLGILGISSISLYLLWVRHKSVHTTSDQESSYPFVTVILAAALITVLVSFLSQ